MDSDRKTSGRKGEEGDDEDSSGAPWEIMSASSAGLPSVSTKATSIVPSQTDGEEKAPALKKPPPSSSGSKKKKKLEDVVANGTEGGDMGNGIKRTSTAKETTKNTKKKAKDKLPNSGFNNQEAKSNDVHNNKLSDMEEQKKPAAVSEKEEDTRQTSHAPDSAGKQSKEYATSKKVPPTKDGDVAKTKSVGSYTCQAIPAQSSSKREAEEYSINHPTVTPASTMVRHTKSDTLRIAPGREPSRAHAEDTSQGTSSPGAEAIFPSGRPGSINPTWHSLAGDAGQSEGVVEAHIVKDAHIVDEDSRYERLKEQVENAPRAEVIDLKARDVADAKMRKLIFFIGAPLILICVAVGIAVRVTSKPSSPRPLLPSLQRIRQRGYVKCRGQPVEQEQGSGLSLDLCSAIAAAILGDPTKYKMELMPFSEQFEALASGKIDISTAQTTSTVERDILISSILSGVTFSTPYVYGGASFFGIPEYVDCADRGDTLLGNCRNLAVCVAKATVWADMVENILGGSVTYEVSFNSELLPRLLDGTCNVITSSPLTIHEQLAEQSGDTAEQVSQYVLAPRSFARDPLTLTTRNDDVEFSDMVNWIVRALVVAETMDITQDTAHLFPTTDLFGEDYVDMFQNAIAAGGNYAELYKQSLQDVFPRGAKGINTPHLNAEDGGLLYPIPLGEIDKEITSQVGPVPGGTLEIIGQREKFNCGILEGRPGLAEWNETANDWMGIDVDFCRGIAAALFAGDYETELELVPFQSVEDGFLALFEKEVDALAGAVYNMVNDIREPTTEQGFAFGDIYYYQQDGSDVKTLAMATREDDVQWTDFVRSLVTSTIHAEAFDINQATAVDMPLFELLGSVYLQAFRDVILAVGSYAEIYERNMETHIPRISNTRNTLNGGETPMFFANWKF